MKRVLIKIFLIVLPIAFLFIGGCELFEEDFNKPEYNDSIKIGVVGDVSALREQVESIFFGAALAQEEINDEDGIFIQNGKYPIELIYKNSAGNPVEGLKVIDELIEEGVQIIIGPTFSSVAKEMAEKCIQNNILMITYSATTPELTYLEDDSLIWRTCTSDFTFGNASGKYAINELQTQKAAIFYRNDRYGIGLSSIIKESFTSNGGEITKLISYPENFENQPTYDIDYMMASLLDIEPDIIFIVAFSAELPYLTNAMYNNSLFQNFEKQPYIFVNDGILTEDLLKNMIPEVLETMVGITSTNEDNSNYQEFKENYLNRFGFIPSTYSEHAYDAIYLIAYAIQMANSTDPDMIKKYLHFVSGSNQDLNEAILINVNEYNTGRTILLRGGKIDYEGASGSINFNEYGDPESELIIWGYQDGDFVILTHYNSF